MAGRSGGLPMVMGTGRGAQLIVDGAPLVMVGGELHNSSASSLEFMESVWGNLTALHCNTVLAVVSWELLEPEEGTFDFELVTGLVQAARRHGLKLVFLWFGTLKNADSTYVPAWVKTDVKRFVRAEMAEGQRRRCNSVFCEETVAADARAFAALMRHIREIDAGHHTVVMMQVENEVGILEQPRDLCAAAKEAWGRAVPAELMGYLAQHRAGLRVELKSAWETAGAKTKGTWAEVFGETGEEVFMAWHMARLVDRVAAAGAAEYPLPMFANAWLVQFDGEKAGAYPSGGPVSRMMDVWKAAGPHLFAVAPDIYLTQFAAVCGDYVRGDNPLLIPEARRDHDAPANVWYAIGECDALCFAPFGIDSIGRPDPTIGNIVPDGVSGQNATANATLLAASYKMISEMMGVITSTRGTGRMIGVLQDDARMKIDRELGGCVLAVRWNQERKKGVTPGAGIIIDLGGGEFLLAGHGFKVDLWGSKPGEVVELISVEEGEYREGQWVARRRLNGDEFWVGLGTLEVGARRVKVWKVTEQAQGHKGNCT